MSTIFDRLKALEQSKCRLSTSEPKLSVEPIKSALLYQNKTVKHNAAPRRSVSFHKRLSAAILLSILAMSALIAAMIFSSGAKRDREVLTAKAQHELTAALPEETAAPPDVAASVKGFMDEYAEMMLGAVQVAAAEYESHAVEKPILETAKPVLTETEAEETEQIALLKPPPLSIAEVAVEIEEDPVAEEQAIISQPPLPEEVQFVKPPSEPIKPLRKTTAAAAGSSKKEPSTFASIMALVSTEGIIAQRVALLSNSVRAAAEEIESSTVDNTAASRAKPSATGAESAAIEQLTLIKAQALPEFYVPGELEQEPPAKVDMEATEDIAQEEKRAPQQIPEPAKPVETITRQEDEENRKILTALRKLSFSYLSDGSGRVALIEGRTIREGQTIRKLTVSRIEPTGIVFSCKSKAYRVIWSR